MKHGRFLCSLFLVAGLVLVPGQLAAQHDHDHGNDHGRQEMNEEMAAWMALSEPSKEHAFLESLVGTWNAKSRFWMIPNAPPIESAGVSTNEMILGGRFLLSKFVGEMFGPFEGVGIDGFDRLKQKYVSTWMDNKGTTIMSFQGEVQDNVRTLMMELLRPDGGKSTMKWVTTIVGQNEHKAEGYEAVAGGDFRKTMEIVYTRQ